MKLSSVEKVLLLLSPDDTFCGSGLQNTILIGKYLLNPRKKITKISGRLDLSLSACKMKVLAWVRTKSGQYYFDSTVLLKMKYWE